MDGFLGITPGLIGNILSYALLAYSVHLSLRAGMFSVAGVAFWALSGYIVANFEIAGLSPVLGVVVAVAVCAAVGAVLGLILGRLRALYLTMSTFSLVLLAQVLVQNGGDFTGGLVGLFGLPIVLNPATSAIVVAVVCVGVLLLQFGRPGRTIEALREDEQLATAQGIRVSVWRMGVFTLSAAVGALAGAVNVLQFGLVTPETASFAVVVQVLLIVVIGGTGAWYGPLIGAFIVLWLPEILGGLRDWVTIVQGVLVVAIVVYFPDGAVGLVRLIASQFRRLRRKPTKSPEVA